MKIPIIKHEKMKHLIAFVRWDIILEWKKHEIIENKLSKKEQTKPYAYGTSAKGISNNIHAEDTLWIFTIPRYGSLPSSPSLVAKLKISEVIDQKNEKNKENLAKIPNYIRNYRNPKTGKGWQYAILAKRKESRYFPINDAYNQIARIIALKDKTQKFKKKISRRHYGYIAQHFQTVRKIADDPYEELETYMKQIKKLNTVFISYKHRKSSKIIKSLVEGLIRKKINCWLDINRMPQKISEEDKARKYFRNEIKHAIEESTYFLALTSEKYNIIEKGKFNWTGFELETAKVLEESGKLKVKKIEINELNKKRKMSSLIDEIKSSLSRGVSFST